MLPPELDGPVGERSTTKAREWSLPDYPQFIALPIELLSILRQRVSEGAYEGASVELTAADLDALLARMAEYGLLVA